MPDPNHRRVAQVTAYAASAVFLVTAVMAPAAAADSVLVRNADDSVSITANQADAPVEISAFTCGPFIFGGGCDPTHTEFTSAKGFDEASDECSDVSGGAATTIRCGPAAPRLSVVATDGADSITSDGNFLNAPALTVQALGGDDRVDGSLFGSDQVNGGSGDDTISLLSGSNTADGGDGDDEVTTGEGADTLAGQEGEDLLSSGGGDDSVDGGTGDDRLTGAQGADLLTGGSGRNTIDGGEGDDTLRGGEDRDRLNPGTGNDTVEGGAGIDLVAYAERGADVRVVLGAAGNGEGSEDDILGADVEDVITGDGNDTVVGTGGHNGIETGSGNDNVDARGGSDFVDLASGDDTVSARDGAVDRIECGAGTDRAVTDEFDVTSNCEVNESSRELMSDVDNDGVAAPVDCDDRDALRRPGLPDQPGNGIDEDCDGGDAAFARILSAVEHTFRVRGGRTRFTRLVVVDIPDRTTAELRCRGGRKRGCKKSLLRRRAFENGKERLRLTGRVRKLRLRRGARLEVRLTRPATIGKVVRYRMRGRKAPVTRVRCVRPGERRVRRC